MSRKERNSGAAMVIVLCVMVVFLALSTTIILAGSVTLNTARNNIIYERGKIQAASLSELFAKDIVNGSVTEESSATNPPNLVRYVRDEIVEKGWPAYDEEKDGPEGAIKTFTMDTTEEGGEGSKHQIRIEMYWTSDEELTTPIGDEAELEGKNLHLFVDVISTLNGSEYHVKREFLSSVTEDTSNSGKYFWKWTVKGRSGDRK